MAFSLMMTFYPALNMVIYAGFFPPIHLNFGKNPQRQTIDKDSVKQRFQRKWVDDRSAQELISVPRKARRCGDFTVGGPIG